jgi:hypothetical protein
MPRQSETPLIALCRSPEPALKVRQTALPAPPRCSVPNLRSRFKTEDPAVLGSGAVSKRAVPEFPSPQLPDVFSHDHPRQIETASGQL